MTPSDVHGAFYLAAANRAPRLERAEEAALAWRLRAGDRAAGEALARASLRQVVAVARQCRRYGVPIGELIAEGNVGLVHALHKYDPQRGTRFATYAAYWVRAYVLAYVLKSWSMVGGGSGALRPRLFFRLRRERVRALNMFGEGEAAEQMVAERVGMTVEELAPLLRRLDARDVSLDTATGESSSTSLMDRLVGHEDQERSLFEEQAENSLRGVTEQALALLDARERYIAEHRLMADLEDELSLAQIGRVLGVSRERARQLESRTKRKLRRSISSLSDPVAMDWIDDRLARAPAA